MKNYNTTLTEKQQKYQHYHHVKLINMNLLQVNKFHHLIKVEHAKSTYSPLGKAFEKQTKTIKEQEEKQLKALEEHGKQLVKSNKFGEKSISLHKQKEILCKLVVERSQEIEKLRKSVNFKNLIYYFKGSTKYRDFNDFINSETLFDDIKLKDKRFEDVEKIKWNLS